MEEATVSPVVTTPSIGDPFEGGYYAGQIRIGADLFALIVAPKAGGEVSQRWHPEWQDVPGARSRNDGAANTVAMAEAGSQLAKDIQALDIGGRKHWYLPSRDEVEMLYRAFKPTEEENYAFKDGHNPSSVPPGEDYTEESPAQTSIAAFKAGGAEAFEERWYWSSTQYSADGAWGQGFGGGGQLTSGKGYEAKARAVRRFKLNP